MFLSPLPFKAWHISIPIVFSKYINHSTASLLKLNFVTYPLTGTIGICSWGTGPLTRSMDKQFEKLFAMMAEMKAGQEQMKAVQGEMKSGQEKMLSGQERMEKGQEEMK
ncbi:hypothetical protein AVEN_234990-1 [Araneus ventricosus]|uniref:Uncharacterized protein n=1 Tax=Araneus ventricosus TaxID=182803 RepID=A0A4Y2FM15_ARAVE|nr:hypothetical protein AVEN_234990-1 [Araneus ventricosus]